jgi:ferric-dicitrate binding protein FerR (iron transport regulator)
LFRPMDHESMAWAFDLASYDEVKENATAILERLRDGRCPVTASGRKSRWHASSDGPRRACTSSANLARTLNHDELEQFIEAPHRLRERGA